MKLIIKDVLALLPSKNEAGRDVITKATIYIENNAIAGVSAHSDETASDPEPFSHSKADKIIDGRDKMVIPGLVNAHTHSYMCFMRNAADDLSFTDWLFNRVSHFEDEMTDEDAYWGAKLAIIEMMKSGTTCFNDMQMNIHQTTKAVKESGMRAVISRGLVGNGNDEAGAMRLRQAYEEKEAAADCDRLSFYLGPHAPYTCDEEFLKIVSNEAKKNQMGIHIHLSESVTEIENCRKQYGCSPIELAKRAGIFDVPCVAAHCVQVDKTDMEILKEYNVSVATNPASNMKLGNGFAPIPEMLQMGINVCLGTDGAASNNSLNMFHELNLLMMVHKGVKCQSECISAPEGIRIATLNGARALGLEKEIGSIEKGKKADLAILNLNQPSLRPLNQPLSALCYSANGSEVDTVIIDGRIVMENRVILTMDEAEIYERCEEISRRIIVSEGVNN